MSDPTGTIDSVISLADAGVAAVVLIACIVLWRKFEAVLNQRDADAEARANDLKMFEETRSADLKDFHETRVSDLKEFQETRQADLEIVRDLHGQVSELKGRRDTIEEVVAALVDTVRNDGK